MALITDMGVRPGEQEILQPMLKNRFRVEFIGIGGGAADRNTLTLQVISADRPKLSFDEVVLNRYNSKAYLAGKHQFETINIIFESDIGGGVIETLQAQLEQQQKLIAPTASEFMGARAAAGFYKFQTHILQLDGDWEPGGEPFEKWELYGCYLANVDWGDLDYSASETVKITTTIRYDHAIQKIQGRDGSAVLGPYSG